MRLRSTFLFLCLTLGACGGGAPEFATRQSVVLPDGRRVEVAEDARLTPAMRQAMWGGPKDPASFLAAPGVAASAEQRQSFIHDEVRRALVRLVDHDGKVLYQRRLDCELAEIAAKPLAQGAAGEAWAVGDDCSVGGGSYAGLITRFFTVGESGLVWQGYTDPVTGEHNELTLVEAEQIRWHLVQPGRAENIVEVSVHPDFADPRIADLKPGAPLPPNPPMMAEYIRYRYDGAGGWTRAARAERPATWTAADDFPGNERFPP